MADEPARRRPPREPAHRESKPDADIPQLQSINNDLILFNADKWFKKSYALDFGQAHTEIPAVLEQINEAIQRAAIHTADAKKQAEQLEGERLMSVRRTWAATYEDKMTESTVAAVLAQDKDLMAAWHRYSVLKSWVSRLENTMENLRLKLGAMRSFEATRRKTLDDDV
jgi:hypothetical protein